MFFSSNVRLWWPDIDPIFLMLMQWDAIKVIKHARKFLSLQATLYILVPTTHAG